MRPIILRAAIFSGAPALVASIMGATSASAIGMPDDTVISPRSSVTNGSISAETEGYWPKPDGCGSYLVSFSGVTSQDIGSIDIVDASSGSTIASEPFLFEDVSAGVFSTQICSFEVEDTNRLRLVLDFGGRTVQGPSFRWDSNGAPSPRPQGLPGEASLGPIEVSTEGIWTAPTGCGNYLFSYSGITDDDMGTVRLVDPSTRDIVAVEAFLGRVENGLGNFQICESDMRVGQPLVWQLEFSDLGLVEGKAFTWQSRAPKPASPKALPGTVSLGPIAVSTTGDWSYPGSCRDLTFAYVGWSPDVIGTVTLIEATTRDVIASEIFLNEASRGTGDLFVCSFDVTPSDRLLLQIDASGYGTAEGDVFTWDDAASSILITGSRTTIKGKPGIRINGSVIGMSPGTRLVPKVKFGKGKFQTLKASIRVNSNLEFSWKRKTKKKSVVIIQTTDGSTKSNKVKINPR